MKRAKGHDWIQLGVEIKTVTILAPFTFEVVPLPKVQVLVRLVVDWSNYGQNAMATIIAASEAKAKFSELLDRVQNGECFSITLHGEEAAKLLPAKRPTLEAIQEIIAQMKASRSTLNPRGRGKLKIKELVNQGRP
jgi:prevent-host-death family protein